MQVQATQEDRTAAIIKQNMVVSKFQLQVKNNTIMSKSIAHDCPEAPILTLTVPHVPFLLSKIKKTKKKYTWQNKTTWTSSSLQSAEVTVWAKSYYCSLTAADFMPHIDEH